MSEHPMGLGDADFWGEPAVGPFLGSRAGRLDEELLIDAPGAIDLAVRDTLPVGVYWRAAMRKLSEWDASTRLHVAAVHLGSHWSHVARAFPLPRLPREPVADEEPFEPGDGVGSLLSFFDLRERLGVPWKPGTLLVTGVVGDQVTNRLRIQLGQPASVFEDEAVEEYLEMLRGRPRAAEVTPPPGDPYPSYGFQPVTLPEGIGITVKAERVVVLEPGARMLVHGGFLLPLLARERLPAGVDLPAVRAAVGRPPIALVPLKLFVLGSRTLDCAVIPMRVPVFEPPETVAGRPVVHGYFALDLLAFEDVPRDGQTLFVYAMADEVLTGPTPIGVITAEMLP